MGKQNLCCFYSLPIFGYPNPDTQYNLILIEVKTTTVSLVFIAMTLNNKIKLNQVQLPNAGARIL
jgi:hypothetical protein